jgi:hypothetical protein
VATPPGLVAAVVSTVLFPVKLGVTEMPCRVAVENAGFVRLCREATVDVEPTVV